MKQYFSIPALMVLFTAMLLSGCIKDQCEQTITYLSYEPVYRSFEEIRTAIGNESAREITNPGKIYFKDAYVFISEPNQGIHVINNQNPSNPQPVTFINIPGNFDLAIKGDILYADSYIDLVAIDISDPTQVQEVSRQQEVFPYGSYHEGLWADPDSGIAIDFVEREVTEEMPCSHNGGFFGRPNVFMMEDALSSNVRNFSSNSNLPAPQTSGAEISTGIGGSMARFTILNDYLYAVTRSDLISFDITNLASPDRTASTSITWDVETIFPFNNHLLIGTMTGMYVYALNNPAEPSYLSEFQHARACDPVVAEGDFAYVTLKGGNPCGGFSNQLDVIDISDMSSPSLVATYPMTGPNGLGIRNGVLFICDGDAGLKIYDASNVNAIADNQLAHFSDIHAWDVIPLHNLLLMIGEDGFYQYDYSDLSNIRELSMIPVTRD